MSMQATIENILKHNKLLEAFQVSEDFHVRIENEPYMRLVIERHEDEISIAHYFEQNGDAMRDPEITFRFPDWTPTTITQDPVGRYSEVFFLTENGVQKYRPRLLRELRSFASMWSKNLNNQHFATRGKAISLTHPMGDILNLEVT